MATRETTDNPQVREDQHVTRNETLHGPRPYGTRSPLCRLADEVLQREDVDLVAEQAIPLLHDAVRVDRC
jgi:hypothetical protein